MATTCTIAHKVEAYPCFDNLSIAEKKALMFYFLIKRASAELGVPWLSTTLGNAYNTIAAYTKNATETDRIKAELVIALEGAIDAGASISSDISTLKDEIKCVVNYPRKDFLITAARCSAEYWNGI